MVRGLGGVAAMLDRDPGAVGGGDALDDQRDVEILLDPCDVAPVELRLIDPRIVDPHTAPLMALGDVALAPAVPFAVHCQPEAPVALLDFPAHIVVDPPPAPPHLTLQ